MRMEKMTWTDFGCLNIACNFILDFLNCNKIVFISFFLNTKTNFRKNCLKFNRNVAFSWVS